MMPLLGISLVFVGVGPPARPLDPAVEAALVLVTNLQDLRKLRGQNTVSRLRPIIAVKEMERVPRKWWFLGKAPQAPVSSATVRFDDERLELLYLRLRSEAPADLQVVLAGRLRGKLGKPVSDNVSDDGTARQVSWRMGKEWQVSLARDKDLGVQLVVEPWHEPEEDPSALRRR